MRQESRVWQVQCMVLLFLGLILGALSSTNGTTNTTEISTTKHEAENTTAISRTQGIQTSSTSMDNVTRDQHVDKQIDRNNQSTIGFSSADATTLPSNYTDERPRQENIPALPTKSATAPSASTTLHSTSTSTRKEEEHSSSGGLIAFFVIVFVILIIVSFVFVLKKKKKMSYSFNQSNKSPEASGIPLGNVKV